MSGPDSSWYSAYEKGKEDKGIEDECLIYHLIIIFYLVKVDNNNTKHTREKQLSLFCYNREYE